MSGAGFSYIRMWVIVWDELKRATNLAKHGLDFADLAPEFFAQAKVVVARNNRNKAIGRWQGRNLTVIFRPLGVEAISIISMRVASPSERRQI